MPIRKESWEKAESTKKLEPKSADLPVLHQILERDIAGWRRGEIARELGMSVSRISIITNSPVYVKLKNDEMAKLKTAVIEKVSDVIVNEDAREYLRQEKLNSAKALISLRDGAESENVRLAAATKAFELADKVEEEKHTMTFQMTDKMVVGIQMAFAHKKPVPKESE